MSEKSMWTLIVLAGLALAGVFAWRKGLFNKVFAAAPPRAVGYPVPFAGGLGPQEQGPAGAAGGSGGSTYGKVCNAVYSTGGKLAAMSGDPRAQAAGVVAQVGGPAICAAHEWVAGKAVQGVKAVGSGVVTGAKATGSAAKSVFNNTIGKLF
jgi:hypothetical protein